MAERVEFVQWLADRERPFYGSAFVRMSAVAHAAEVEAAATKSGPLRGRKLNVAFAAARGRGGRPRGTPRGASAGGLREAEE